MIAYLYYGNGECTIEGTEIRGVQIEIDSIDLKIEKTTSDNFILVSNKFRILIFPTPHSSAPPTYGGSFLNDLFIYSGTLKIKVVIAINSSGERVPCSAKRVMDYSELLNSKAEDLTVFSENLRSEYYVKREIIEDKNPIIKNLQTSGRYYLIDGTPYNGYFHVHLNTAAAMTGATHTVESKNLYVKQGNTNKLIHTNKLKRSKRRNKNRRRR